MSHSEWQAWSNILGHQYEDFTVNLLKKIGFDDVHETQATRDYGIDVIAKLNFHQNFGVQCKHVMNKRSKISYRAVEEAVSGIKYYHLSKGIVMTNGRFTSQARDGAHKNHILLWDGVNQILLERMLHAHITIYDLIDYNHLLMPLIHSLKATNFTQRNDYK